MSPDDEDFLTELHRNLEQEDLEPGDPRYVRLQDYEGAVGPDAVTFLARGITRTTRGSLFFLSGLRGAGKSTQLRRLQKELNDRGYAAVRIDAEDYLNLRQPLDVIEFLFFLVGGLSDGVEDAAWLPRDNAARRGWSRLREWLRNLPERISIEPGVEFGAGGGIPGLLEGKVNLKAELRTDESFVARLRRFLDGRLSELTEEANTLVSDVVNDLREVWESHGRDWRGLVVLVDSLDHVRGADFATIRQAVVDLFDKQKDAIRLRECRTVFIVPPYLHIDYAEVRRILNVKVANQDGSANVGGVEALRAVLARRVPQGNLGRLFPSRDALTEVILASGGNMRDLLRIVTEIEVQAERLPVDGRTIDRSLQQVRSGMLPLSQDEIRCLATVAKDHKAPLRSQDEWADLALLYDRHLVLGYHNGEDWYDVHPLLRELVERG